MTRNLGTDKEKGLFIGLGVAAAAGVGTLLYYYLSSRSGQTDVPFIPQAIEERLDYVVEALNHRFGKKWVDKGLGALRAGLAAMLPAPLVGLVEVVHKVEVAGHQHGWNGLEKQHQALKMS